MLQPSVVLLQAWVSGTATVASIATHGFQPRPAESDALGMWPSHLWAHRSTRGCCCSPCLRSTILRGHCKPVLPEEPLPRGEHISGLVGDWACGSTMRDPLFWVTPCSLLANGTQSSGSLLVEGGGGEWREDAQ